MGARRRGRERRGEEGGRGGKGRGERKDTRRRAERGGREAGGCRGGAGGGPGGRGAGWGGAVSARRRAECSGRRPGHVRTRGRGPRPPRPGARRRPPEAGSPRGCGYGAGGAGGRAGGASSQIARWALGNLVPPGPAGEGRRPRRQKSSSARTREEAGLASAWAKFWSSRRGRGDASAGLDCDSPGGLGSRGAAPGLGLTCVLLESDGPGAGGARRAQVQPRPLAAGGGGSAPLSPRPRFCDTLRLGLWSSQCMTELGPGRTLRTQWAQRPPGACSGPSAWEGSGHSSGPCGIGLGRNQLWIFGVGVAGA